MKIQVTAVIAFALASGAHAQEAVQWKVSDGGNGHWYLKDTTLRTWSAGRQFAEGRGGHLATFDSPTEQGTALHLTSNRGSSVWIGLVQSPSGDEPGGGWMWVTGEQLVFWDWADNGVTNPNDGSSTGEDVGEWTASWGSGWNDMPDAEEVKRPSLIEWSADCNADGIVDYGQILDGTLADLNTNGVPDLCECPTSIRVPEDAPSIDAAADRACIGIPMQITVAEGTWPMSVARAGDLRITVVGASRTNTVVVEESEGVPLNAAVAGAAQHARITLKNLTVSGVRLSENRQVGLEACDVRNCAATFLPGDLPVIDNLVVDSSPGPHQAIVQSPLVMNSTTFNRCAKPVLLVTDGARALVDCHFNDCAGPAVAVRTSASEDAVNAARLDRCTFNRCAGGAVTVDTVGPASAPVMDARFIECSFTDNAYAPFGSAVCLGTPASVRASSIGGRGEFVRCAFVRNSAPTGGALYQAANHPARLESCTFTDNVATAGDGGAVAQEFGGDLQALTVSGGTFRGNRAALQGGAIRCTGWEGTVEIANATFQENEAEFQGGAIGIDRQSIAIADCAFTGNRSHEPAYEGGGAIYVVLSPDNGTANTIFRSQFAGNTTPGRGGAIALYFGVDTDVTDCTFTGNQAGHVGGAISVNERCSSVISASRMSANSAPTGAAVHCMGTNYADDPVVRVQGCDFASNVGAGTVASTNVPSIEVSGNVACDSGESPFVGSVSEIGPSCTTQFCTDFNDNGRPDGCECASNPNLPSCCIGDIFSDNLVNGGDLGILLSQWGQSGVAADLDASGVVDGADLGLLLSNWGPCGN